MNKKLLKTALITASLTAITPIVMTAVSSELDTARLGITMGVSLFLVLGIYSGIKSVLFEDLQGVFNRKLLFKSGMTVTTLTALIYSLGSIVNDVVHEDKLFDLQLKSGIELLDQRYALENPSRQDEEITAELEQKIEEFKNSKDQGGSLLMGGASKVLFIMFFGAIYSLAIPYILKQSPQIKAINKINK